MSYMVGSEKSFSVVGGPLDGAVVRGRGQGKYLSSRRTPRGFRGHDPPLPSEPSGHLPLDSIRTLSVEEVVTWFIGVGGGRTRRRASG